MPTVTIITNANIALIKYWGKRDTQRMLPTKSSISLSLEALVTKTTIHFNSEKKDIIHLDGIHSSSHTAPLVDFLNTARAIFKLDCHFTITSKNSFPTASGLASSASGLAAIALGINELCSLKLSPQDLSILARLGSGSAARSIPGGFAMWHRGTLPDGSDSYAEQLTPASTWPTLRVIIVITTTDVKKVSSRSGMQASVATSSYYATWLERSQERIEPMINAITTQDFHQLGMLAEADWADMRHVMLTTTPQLDYWNEASHRIIEQVKKLRADGIDCYITTDAGPHVKILCLTNQAAAIANSVRTLPGVIHVVESTVAGAPRVANL